MKRRNVLALAFVFIAAISIAAEAPSKAVERIRKEVQHRLLMLPYLTVFDNLAYGVHGYDVLLRGEVTQPALKADAESAVKRIEGVEHVENDIEVLPPSPMDQELRRQLRQAIYKYPPLRKYSLSPQPPIRIIVKNGNVTLEGVVDSTMDKNMAGMRANGVPGVFSVTNHLQVVKS